MNRGRSRLPVKTICDGHFQCKNKSYFVAMVLLPAHNTSHTSFGINRIIIIIHHVFRSCDIFS